MQAQKPAFLYNENHAIVVIAVKTWAINAWDFVFFGFCKQREISNRSFQKPW